MLSFNFFKFIIVVNYKFVSNINLVEAALPVVFVVTDAVLEEAVADKDRVIYKDV